MSPRLHPLPVLLILLLACTAQAADDAPLVPATAARAPLPAPATAASAPAAPSAVWIDEAAATTPAATLPASAAGAPATMPAAPSDISPAALAAELKKDAQVVEPYPAPAATAPLPQPVRRGDEVFARIRRGLGSNVCTAGENSERWRRRYASNPAAFANRIERILPLLDFVSVEVERVGLPSEFTFIPLVESWYKPDATGVGGPAGMWQMIGSTARNHGIHIKDGYDGRLSPVESTRAALSYLKLLQGMFGGWEATVMAYNAGEGRMMQAYRRARSHEASGDRRRPHGLSNITYDYVAKLQALSCLMSQPERNNLVLPRVSRFVPLAPVLMDAGVSSLDQFANRQGRNAADLRRLNPGYREGRVVAGVPRLVLVPLGVPQAEPAVSAPSTDGGGVAALAAIASGLQVSRVLLPEPSAIDASLVSVIATPPDATPGQVTRSEWLVADADVDAIEPPASMQQTADAAPPATHPVSGAKRPRRSN